jgi:hypothetical protein
MHTEVKKFILDAAPTNDPANNIRFNNLNFSNRINKSLRPIIHWKYANIRDSYGNDLAHLAAMHDRPNILKFCQELGMDLSRPNNLGMTPLHYAVLLSSHQALKELAKLVKVENLYFPEEFDEIIASVPKRFAIRVKNTLNQLTIKATDNKREAIDLLDVAAFNQVRAGEITLRVLLRLGIRSSNTFDGLHLGAYLINKVSENAFLRGFCPYSSQQDQIDFSNFCRNGSTDDPLPDMFKTNLSYYEFYIKYFSSGVHFKNKETWKFFIANYSDPALAERANFGNLNPLPKFKATNFGITVLENWQCFKHYALKYQPQLEFELNQLEKNGSLANKDFGVIVSIIGASLISIDPEINPLTNPLTYLILNNSVIERYQMRQSWKNYLQQKIIANKYLIDGLRDLVNEYTNAVIYPLLVNRLMAMGYDFRSIWRSKELRTSAQQIALNQLFSDKSIGSIFRFNTLWHRADMRLPDSVCPGLDLREWYSLLKEGSWSFNDDIKIVELSTGSSLSLEGESMDHCVRGRAYLCGLGQSHIFSIRKNGVSIATVEAHLDKTRVKNSILKDIEIKGLSNTSAPAEARVAWESFKLAIRNDSSLIQTDELGWTNEFLRNKEEADYQALTFILPGTAPSAAIAHYEALRIYMNNSKEEKFLVGAFRPSGFSLSAIINQAVDSYIPESVKTLDKLEHAA